MTNLYLSDNCIHITVSVGEFRMDTSGSKIVKFNHTVFIGKQCRRIPCP